MRVLVVGVGLADLAAEAVDGEVHLGEPDGLVDSFLAVDRELGWSGSSGARSTKRADWTNMPPEPQAGSKMRPWNGSMISTISRTIEVGVKNSPPFWPSVMANLPRKYS